MTTHLIDSMKDTLCQAFNVSHIEIIDESHKHVGHAGSNGGGHFRLTLVAEEFTGKSRLDRQRLVLDLFKDLIPQKIHALSIKAMSPSEFQEPAA